MRLEQRLKFGTLKPFPSFDLFGMKNKWTFGRSLVNSDKFISRFAARIDPKHFRGDFPHNDTNLFPRFAHHRRLVALTRIKMTGGRAVPKTRRDIFAHRTLLKEELARLVEYQQMHRSVEQALAMHNRTKLRAHDHISLVDNIKPLVSIRSRRHLLFAHRLLRRGHPAKMRKGFILLRYLYDNLTLSRFADVRKRG